MDLQQVLIRSASQNDLEAIVYLLQEDVLGSAREKFQLPLPQAYKEAFLKISQDPNAVLAVAEWDGRVIGTFQLNFSTHLTYQGSTIAQISGVRVSLSLRGQKVGEKMMSWAVTQAKNRGCHSIQLTTDKSRKDAHRFYQRIGFNSTHEGMSLLI